MGPVPYIDNSKFLHNVTLSGDERYLSVVVTRRDSIEHNIMMTFLVENGIAVDPGSPLTELSAHAENNLVQEYIYKYAK